MATFAQFSARGIEIMRTGLQPASASAGLADTPPQAGEPRWLRAAGMADRRAAFRAAF
jgi:hypothetical protein